jgi:hypothetical protein
VLHSVKISSGGSLDEKYSKPLVTLSTVYLVFRNSHTGADLITSPPAIANSVKFLS